MRKASAVCRKIIFVLLAVVLAVQVLVVVSIQMNNYSLVQSGAGDQVFPLTFLILADVLLLGGALLFGFYKKRRYLGLLLCVVAAVAFIVLALEIQREFPTSVGADGRTRGITVARMITRHMSPVLIPVLMLPAWLLERASYKREPLKEFSEKSGFDLSGEPVFQDQEERVLPAKKAGSTVQRRKGR